MESVRKNYCEYIQFREQVAQDRKFCESSTDKEFVDFEYKRLGRKYSKKKIVEALKECGYMIDIEEIVKKRRYSNHPLSSTFQNSNRITLEPEPFVF